MEVSGKTFSQLIREYPLGTRRIIANNIEILRFFKDLGGKRIITIKMQALKNFFSVGGQRKLSFPYDSNNPDNPKKCLWQEVSLRNQ